MRKCPRQFMWLPVEKRRWRYVAAPRPELALLDLNLPKVDGYQVLEAMKADAVM